jgi:signal transduction histidine kinase
MSRTRRLSLRARMLVMLIGVTTVLLLIMGTVSTIVLIHRVDRQGGQFEAALRAQSMEAPKVLRNNTAGYAAVEVPIRRQLTAIPLTAGNLTQLTSQLAAAVDRRLNEPGFAGIRQLAAGGHLVRVAFLLKNGGGEPLLYLGTKPFDITKGIRAAGRWIEARQAGGPAMLFVARPVPDEPGQVRGFIIAELITGAALIALLALAGEWLIGRGLEPLDQMTSTANEITSRGDLTARMPDADDQTEVGRLGASINTMLDRIQQAFSSRLHSEQKVREFAADASHELRTPLTTIRGYAELYRQGALGPDQLPSAMRRIEQEAQRMSTLVAELLELARLDRTSSLDLTETDLASVVRDAVADAVAVEPQRPVRAEAPPRLVAVVDEARLRQVLANLLGNVRAHTPVTTPVAVRLGEITGGVLIEVADAGPGMSRQDAIRAFDRFHRAAERPGPAEPEDSGRGAATERSGGSGLGLSIVQAIASAHGGRATLESRPGQGTKVRVWLPVRIVP